MKIQFKQFKTKTSNKKNIKMRLNSKRKTIYMSGIGSINHVAVILVLKFVMFGFVLSAILRLLTRAIVTLQVS